MNDGTATGSLAEIRTGSLHAGICVPKFSHLAISSWRLKLLDHHQAIQPRSRSW
jgi:hypothetical protein